MLWPFSHIRKSRPPSRGTIETIYGMIVAQAREPLFYQELAIPDTVDGRFDMIVLHLWMVLRRLRPAGDGVQLSQELFDRFCSDMDANLRELGVGDLTVPKRMRKFGEAFYGRAAAYDEALAAGGDALPLALGKNIFNGARRDAAERLAGYVGSAMAALAALDDSTLRGGSWRFPSPALSAARQSAT